jgi:hypothetical protein
VRNKQEWKLLPYGAYLLRDGSAVLFDRRYRPILRLPAVALPLVRAASVVIRGWPAVATLPIDGTDPCSPDERIEHVEEIYFYRSKTEPDRDPRTRAALEKLVAEIPQLAAEIRRRKTS